MNLTRRFAASFTIVTLLGFPSAASAVDLSATYRIVTSPPNYSCLVTFTQTGAALSLSGSCSGFGGNVFATGTVDTGTGEFSVTGYATYCPTPGSLALDGVGDGTTMSGSFVCLSGGTFLGSTCGNDMLDAGEQCDDGQNFYDGDCCSSTCQLDPDGSVCIVDDGNLCTSEACDGAGTCQHLPDVPAGQGCLPDNNSCTDDVCDGAGACVHPASFAGAPCDSDYIVCTDDVCDGAGACLHPPSPASESCEDYNPCTMNDACDGSGTCTGEPLAAGTPCQFTTCSVSECNGAGFCAKISDDCAPCGSCTCNGLGGCGCETGECIASGPSKLTLVTRDPDTEDRAKWSWKSLPQTEDAEFEDPLSSTDYAFCAYGSDGYDYTSISIAEMPAGSGWTSTPTGFKYKDSELTAFLRTDKAGRRKIKFRGEGPVLNLPAAFSDYPDVRVLVRTLNQCWGAGYYNDINLKVEPDRIRGK